MKLTEAEKKEGLVFRTDTHVFLSCKDLTIGVEIFALHQDYRRNKKILAASVGQFIEYYHKNIFPRLNHFMGYGKIDFQYKGLYEERPVDHKVRTAH